LISWISGEIIYSWTDNQKSYILINCNGLGYEIQTLKIIENNIKTKNTTLWINHVKKEDSDNFYGFLNKEERDFFRDLLKVKGIGPQIGMSLLTKYSLNEIINSLKTKNDKLISSVPGIGKKMTERIFFEMKNKFLNDPKVFKVTKESTNNESKKIELIINDVEIALRSLDYSNKEIKNTIDNLRSLINESFDQEKNVTENITFEKLLKDAFNLLDKNDSNFA
tara:strand:- start:3263 stop:3931 length:669 start_codon:yes stop_codon:yes gene_type:complete